VDTQDRDEQLCTLWAQAFELKASEQEHAQLRNLVLSVLKPVAKRYDFIGLEAESLIEDFYIDRIIVNRSVPFMKHTGALISMFRNYLIDFKRSKKNHSSSEQSYLHGNEEHDEPEVDINNNPIWQPSFIDDLFMYGLSIESVQESAYCWVKEQEPWVIWMLALHTCGEDDNHEPLCKIAKYYDIPAYHSKAVKLGITRGKYDQLGESSMIGKWLCSLLKTDHIEADAMGTAQLLISILCFSVSDKLANDGKPQFN